MTSSYPLPLTFWFKSLSIFDLLVLTTFISSSHLFPIPSHSKSNQVSGSKATSLPPRPLRTHRASFPAIRSSLSNAHLGGRGAATYDCCCTCTFVFASDARGGFHR